MNARFTRGCNDLRKTYRSHDFRIRISGCNLACGSSASADGVPEFCIAKRSQSKFYGKGYYRTARNEGLVKSRLNLRSLLFGDLRPGEPNEIVREIHTRMPVILPEK